MKNAIRLTVPAVIVFAATLSSSAAGQTAPQAPPVVEPGPTAQTPPPVERPRRPYRGLFEGSETRVGANGLGLSVSGFGGYDDNVVADQPGSVTRTPVAGTYGGAVTTLVYRTTGNRSSFTAIGSTQVRLYEDDVAPSSFSQSVDLAATIPLSRRFTLSATHGAAHSPYYQMSFLPGLSSQEFADEPAIEPLDIDQSVTALETYRYDGSLRLRQEINRTSDLRYEYAFAYTDFESGLGDTHMQRGLVRYTRRVTRYGTLRLGYGYQDGESGFETPSPTRLHLLDLGGGYARPLSFSRRTTIGGRGGVVMTDSPLDTRRYHAVGDVTVHHEIGRTWLLRGAYEQSVRFVEAFPEPFYGFAARTSLVGLLSRRAEFLVDGGYSEGRRLSVVAESPYSSVYASTQLRFALTRSMAWYVQYSFNGYTFSQPVDLPPAIAPEFDRYTLRTGVNLWIPLFTPRTRDASR